MVPVVYWLVLFSIMWHGLSIPALGTFYRFKGVQPITEEEPAEISVLSDNAVVPTNAYGNPKRKFIIVHNRFSRPISGNEPALFQWRFGESLATLTTHVQSQELTISSDEH